MPWALLFLFASMPPTPVRVVDSYDDGSFTTLPTSAMGSIDGVRFSSGRVSFELVLVRGHLRLVSVESVVHGY